VVPGRPSRAAPPVAEALFIQGIALLGDSGAVDVAPMVPRAVQLDDETQSPVDADQRASLDS
jgi:hypothetical protein